MREFYLKAKRAIRFLFYKDLNIIQQMQVSEILDDENLEMQFWKMSKADREHSLEVLQRTRLHTNDNQLLKLSLLHDVGKSLNEYSWIFRIFTELSFIRNNKSKQYLAHENIGKELLIKGKCNPEIIEYYTKHLLEEKHEILDSTDY